MVQAVRAYTMQQLSPEAVAKVKTALLDMLSCAFEAQDLPWSQQAIARSPPFSEATRTSSAPPCGFPSPKPPS